MSPPLKTKKSRDAMRTITRAFVEKIRHEQRVEADDLRDFAAELLNIIGQSHASHCERVKRLMRAPQGGPVTEMPALCTCGVDDAWAKAKKLGVNPSKLLLKQQFRNGLKTAALEAAANEEYRRGRYHPERGGPALKALNEHRRKTAKRPKLSEQERILRELEQDTGESGE